MHPSRFTAAFLIAAACACAPAAYAEPQPPAPPGDAMAVANADAERGPDAGPGPGDRHGPGGFHPGPGRGPGLPFLRGMELNEAQQDRLFAILHAEAPRLREQEKAERKAHEALRAMFAAGDFKEANAAAHAKALGQAVAARELLRVRTAGQVMALLTPEQRARLKLERDERQSARQPAHQPAHQ